MTLYRQVLATSLGWLSFCALHSKPRKGQPSVVQWSPPHSPQGAITEQGGAGVGAAVVGAGVIVGADVGPYPPHAQHCDDSEQSATLLVCETQCPLWSSHATPSHSP